MSLRNKIIKNIANIVIPKKKSFIFFPCFRWLRCASPALSALGLDSYKNISLMTAILICGGFATNAKAIDLKEQFASDMKSPIYLEAGKVYYDLSDKFVYAEGQIEITQARNILRMDRLIYDSENGKLYAIDNVKFEDKDGNLLYANSMELNDEFTDAVIDDFRARFVDDTVFAAKKAVKEGEDIIGLEYMSYSPCPVCEGEEPLWQIKAEKAVVNRKKQQITYRHAYLEVLGIPVLYTPYLFHATPGADRKSGLLVPIYRSDDQIGHSIEIPYYINIAPNMDATISPIITTKEGVVGKGEFRHLTKTPLGTGQYEVGGSYTIASKRDPNGNEIDGDESRGHIEARADFEYNPRWHWGGEGKYASDDTYLRRYGLGSETLLTSRAFVEYVGDENDASTQYDNFTVETLAFQDLRTDSNINDDEIPYALPHIRSNKRFQPFADNNKIGNNTIKNSYIDLNTDSYYLYRDEGRNSRKIGTKLGWYIPHNYRGHLLTAGTTLKADYYQYDDEDNPTLTDDSEYRVIPELMIGWSYPLAKYRSGYSIYLEPRMTAYLSPHGENETNIFNEDSLVQDLTYANLYESNHFSGDDIVEGGARVNYGLEARIDDHNRDMSFRFMVGQNYRSKEIDNVELYGTGLDDNLSDIVGRVGLNYQNHLDLGYRYRIDKDSYEFSRNEVNAGVNYQPVSFNFGYSYLDETAWLEEQEDIYASTRIRINEQWSITANGRHDLSREDDQLTSAGFGFIYEDSCFNVNAGLQRNNRRDRDIEPSTSFLLKVSLQREDFN